MSTMTTKSRLFIDLDGTVARFYDASPNYLEEMYEKGYFRNLQPYEKMTEGIKLFMEQHKDVEVFTLSAKVNGEPPYCEAEKQEWLDEYLPEIDREHRLFTEIGHNKAEYIPNGISKGDVLYDDYNKNLIDWENSGGVALKCHNNINMQGLGAYGGDKVMWEGQVLKNDIEPQDIANSLYETVSAAQSMSSVNGKPLNETVRTALKLINDYSVAEFGDTSAYDDVQDLSDVPLAYTTDSEQDNLGIYQTFSEKNVQVENIKSKSTTLIVDIFGGPGAGKSTTALQIVAELKKLGYHADYVSEVAKELVYAKDFEHLDGTLKNQSKILSEQKRRLDIMLDNVDVVVTDSPLLLNTVYLKENAPEYIESVFSQYENYNNYNVVVERDLSVKFEQEGRIHNLEESIKKDGEINTLLDSHNIDYQRFNRNNIAGILDGIVSKINDIKINESITADNTETVSVANVETGEIAVTKEFPIQVSADLENFRIVTEYDNVVAHIDSYNSLEEMNELCFENLNFDDLIYLSEKEKQSAIDKTIIYSTEYNGEIDYFKAADKRLSVLFEKLSKDNTYAELSKAEKISAFEFAEIEQSKNLIASVTFDLDNNNVGIYRLRRAVSEGNRTPNDFISEEHSIAEMKQLVSEAKLNSLNIEKDFRNLLDKRIAERSEKNVVDIIDQYNSSGKSFHEFFEENKDKVIATYTDDIDTAYYSRHINRHWLSENLYIENRIGSDTFGNMTAKSENIVLVNVYDPSKGSILDNTIDGMSWEERLNLPIETETIGKYLIEDLKPSESPLILSAYSDLFGEEAIKRAYLKSCIREAENELAELGTYEDISPYGGEDVSISNFESYLLESLDNAQGMGYTSVEEAVLKCIELGLIDEKWRENVIYEIYDSAESLEELDSLTDYIKQKATSSQVALNIIAGGQEKGIHSVMPFAVNHFDGSKTSYTTNLLTEAASVLIPFSTRVFYNPNGVCYGFEKVNKNLIAIDKDEGMNANTMMFGASGSGKSMLEKLTFIQMYLKHPDYRSIFIDPDGEYTHLLEEMGGVQINITPSSKTKINIFDIDLNYVDKDTQQDPISMKIDFMLMVVELAKKSPLTSSETSILNRCIKHLYQPYIKSGDEKDKPVFSDLYKMLKGQDEDDAKKLALDLEFYADSDYFFDGHTNIDMNNKLIQFNVKNIEKDKTMSLQIILELIWQTVNKNSKNGYRTIFVNDEVQTMLTDYTGQEATRSSKYYEETYRRIRKLGGIPTAIVQNISTFSKSTVGNAMMDNASMTILCQQGEADIEVAAARFKLTPEETKWVSSGVLGTGIIKVGQKKVMYDMRIPRKVRANSLVYELCATDPSK